MQLSVETVETIGAGSDLFQLKKKRKKKTIVRPLFTLCSVLYTCQCLVGLSKSMKHNEVKAIYKCGTGLARIQRSDPLGHATSR